AWRSFWIITIGTVLLLLHNIRKLKTVWMITAIAALCLFDMWTVNKRYLYDDQFVPSGQIAEKVFPKTQTDNFILQDSSLNYRVLNLASNTFNENNTSYWHKSIGGYHAAKLRRYQEVIDRHISREMQNVYREAGSLQESPDAVNPDAFRMLNMLNTKYFVFPADEKGTATVPVKNPYAYGNAWFVGGVQYVNNADEEIGALSVIHPLQTAVIDIRFKDILRGIPNIPKDTAADVRLISYEPNRLVYETSSSTDGVAVFSEIYYPGWEATVDGVPVDIVRANYILRAMNISSGK
ncbi:hypothetical protein EZS27_039530, partial [termite gut metagenome]